MEPLESERLLLRPVVEEDYQDLYEAIFHDRKVLKYFNAPYYATSQGHSITKLAKAAQEPGHIYLSIYEKKLQKVIGIVLEQGVYIPGQEIEIGYALSSSYWGQGYMSEALTILLDYLWKEVHTPRITASVYIENIASQRLLEKMGMKQTGSQKEGNRMVVLYEIQANSLR